MKYPPVIKHGTGKSPMNESFSRKITDQWCIFQQAMFDYRRASRGLTHWAFFELFRWAFLTSIHRLVQQIPWHLTRVGPREASKKLLLSQRKDLKPMEFQIRLIRFQTCPKPVNPSGYLGYFNLKSHYPSSVEINILFLSAYNWSPFGACWSHMNIPTM